MVGLFLFTSLLGTAQSSPDGAGSPICSYLYQPSHCIDHALREPSHPYLPQPGDIMLATDSNFFWKLTHDLAFAFEPHNSAIVFARPDGSLAILEAGPTDPLQRKPEEELTFLERMARRSGTNDTMWVSTLDMLTHLQDYESKGPVWIRRRRVPLTAEESARLTEFALRQEGKRFALSRLALQLTPFRTRGPIRTCFIGKAHGDRRKYYCSELVTEACVAAGLLDAATARPSATYPHDLFVAHSLNLYLRKHLDLSCWEPPARWVSCLNGNGVSTSRDREGTVAAEPSSTAEQAVPQPRAKLLISTTRPDSLTGSR